MNVTIRNSWGLPAICGAEGCFQPASSTWTSAVIAGALSSGPRYSCIEHNPVSLPAAPIAVSFRSQPLCHAFGQPVSVSNLIANETGRAF